MMRLLTLFGGMLLCIGLAAATAHAADCTYPDYSGNWIFDSSTGTLSPPMVTVQAGSATECRNDFFDDECSAWNGDEFNANFTYNGASYFATFNVCSCGGDCSTDGPPQY